MADNNCRQHQQRQINLLDHIDAVQDEVSHRMDFIERELDGKTPARPRQRCPRFSRLLVFLSAGELDGLHGGAGASRTPVASAAAQASHETPVDAAGDGAADLPVQLHMRAPQDGGGSRPPLGVRSQSASLAHHFESDCRIVQHVLKLVLSSFFGFFFFLESGIQCCSHPLSYENMNTCGKSAGKIRNKYKVTSYVQEKHSGPDSSCPHATVSLPNAFLSQLLLTVTLSLITQCFTYRSFIFKISSAILNLRCLLAIALEPFLCSVFIYGDLPKVWSRHNCAEKV